MGFASKGFSLAFKLLHIEDLGPNLKHENEVYGIGTIRSKCKLYRSYFPLLSEKCLYLKVLYLKNLKML